MGALCIEGLCSCLYHVMVDIYNHRMTFCLLNDDGNIIYTSNKQQRLSLNILIYYLHSCIYFINISAPDKQNVNITVEFLKYAINIEKASMIYLSPVQKEHVKRKWLI
jgi:hypothetical protein